MIQGSVIIQHGYYFASMLLLTLDIINNKVEAWYKKPLKRL